MRSSVLYRVGPASKYAGSLADAPDVKLTVVGIPCNRPTEMSALVHQGLSVGRCSFNCMSSRHSSLRLSGAIPGTLIYEHNPCQPRIPRNPLIRWRFQPVKTPRNRRDSDDSADNSTCSIKSTGYAAESSTVAQTRQLSHVSHNPPSLAVYPQSN